jgi:hypothetical protein
MYLKKSVHFWNKHIRDFFSQFMNILCSFLTTEIRTLLKKIRKDLYRSSRTVLLIKSRGSVGGQRCSCAVEEQGIQRFCDET